MTKFMELIDAYASAQSHADWQNDEGWRDDVIAKANDKAEKARAAVVEAVEKLQRDAARYRWLRDESYTVYLKDGKDSPDWFSSDSEDIDAAADAAIDAALGGHKWTR